MAPYNTFDSCNDKLMLFVQINGYSYNMIHVLTQSLVWDCPDGQQLILTCWGSGMLVNSPYKKIGKLQTHRAVSYCLKIWIYPLSSKKSIHFHVSTNINLKLTEFVLEICWTKYRSIISMFSIWFSIEQPMILEILKKLSDIIEI